MDIDIHKPLEEIISGFIKPKGDNVGYDLMISLLKEIKGAIENDTNAYRREFVAVAIQKLGDHLMTKDVNQSHQLVSSSAEPSEKNHEQSIADALMVLINELQSKNLTVGSLQIHFVQTQQ